MTYSGGIDTYYLYTAETSFKSGGTPDKTFGLGTSLDFDLSNSTNPRYGLTDSSNDGRGVKAYIYGAAEHKLSVSFDLTGSDIFKFILGDVSAGVYSASKYPDSMCISYTAQNTSTTEDFTFKGCVVNSATIKGAEGEPITAQLDIMSAEVDTDTSATSPVAETATPLTFVGATFELPSGDTIDNIVNGITISIANNWKFYYGTSRTAQSAVPGKREIKVSLDTTKENSDLITKALGGSSTSSTGPTENATMKAKFVYPGTSDYIEFDFTLLPIDAYKLSDTHGEAIKESVDLFAKTLEITDSKLT